MIDFLGGMEAQDVKARFDVNSYKTDEDYIYLDIKPRLGKDQREFARLLLALHGPEARVPAGSSAHVKAERRYRGVEFRGTGAGRPWCGREAVPVRRIEGLESSRGPTGARGQRRERPARR